MMKHLKLAAGILLCVVVVVFTVQNVEVVEVRFLFWRLELSRALMIFGVLLSGVLIGWFLSEWFRVRSAAKE